MKIKITILLLSFIVLSFLPSIAQNQSSLGQTKLIEFNNENPKFEVPQGKSWVIYSIFSDYVTDGIMKYDEYSKKERLINDKEIRIFLKTLNGIEKTDYTKNIYGPQFYRSTNNSTSVNFPISIPEKTTFNLIILKGQIGELELYNGKGYLSVLEISNQ